MWRATKQAVRRFSSIVVEIHQSAIGIFTVRATDLHRCVATQKLRFRSIYDNGDDDDSSLIACDPTGSWRYYIQPFPVRRPPRPLTVRWRPAATPPAPAWPLPQGNQKTRDSNDWKFDPKKIRPPPLLLPFVLRRLALKFLIPKFLRLRSGAHPASHCGGV